MEWNTGQESAKRDTIENHYTVDTHGNWTRSDITTNGQPSGFVTRVIEYY